MKFNPNNYKPMTCIHCNSPEEWENCRKKLNELGLRWQSGDSYISNVSLNKFDFNQVYLFRTGAWTNYTEAKKNPSKYHILNWSDFMNDKFTKSDLRNFDIIVRRNGDIEIINVDLKCTICKNGWNDLNTLLEDLTEIDASWGFDDRDYDVMKVYRPKAGYQLNLNENFYKEGDLVYDRIRDEVVEMTLEEVCKTLGQNIKIIPNNS